MVEDNDIIQTIQAYCRNLVFERIPQGRAVVDNFKESWRLFAAREEGMEVVEERLTRFTTKRIQAEVQKKFGTNAVDIERKVGGSSRLAFDMWNVAERTAFEICLGPLKNEFEKDLLKGILDKDTTKLVLFYREYGHGRRGVIYGHKWVEQPAQREMVERAGIFKLNVQPLPLLGPVC